MFIPDHPSSSFLLSSNLSDPFHGPVFADILDPIHGGRSVPVSFL